ncbi:hypothetical protein [Shewanella gelidii]|nr:hypothetical protein [Shewanella gelidii]
MMPQKEFEAASSQDTFSNGKAFGLSSMKFGQQYVEKLESI